MAASKNGSKHSWKFFRAGGFDQVRLDTGADIAALDQLNQKLWVALACPTEGLEFDTKTLEIIDTNKDGRIRAPEIIAAAQWACAMLRDPDELTKGLPALPLSSISTATPEGKQLLASAKQILVNLGRGEASSISAEDTADTAKIFAQTQFNGDGIVPVESATDAAVAAVIADIIACLGSDVDRSGKAGITQEKADQFFKELAAYSDWWAKAEGDAAHVLPLGDSTPAAVDAYSAVAAKIDDYFARCQLAAYDPRALAALNRDEKEYLLLAVKDVSATAAEFGGFPLAQVAAGKALPLADGINPAWAGRIAAFGELVVKPILGKKSELTSADWAAIHAKLAAHDAWLATKAGTAVEKLGLARVREILAGTSAAAIAKLIEQDKALEPEASSIAAVERLVRYYRDLHRLLNNYVSFKEFYRREKSVFQVGTLYLDTRSCDLCVRVDDMGRHGLMAHLSCCYLAYCDLVRKATGEKMSIAAAFTNGDSDNLMVGRNGIFYDRKGQDWDATITKITENPISIRQAFFAPYKRVLRWIEDQIAKRAAAADSTAFDKVTAATSATAAGTPPAAPGAPAKLDVGMIAALGVAFGFISTAMGALLQVFFGLGIWMPLGIAGLILLISGPSMVIAWLKLRQRNLGPILDANGWAVNAKAKINVPFGKSLTGIAVLPPGSHRDLVDPYAESNSGPYKLAAIVLLLVAGWASWNFGLIERILPDVLPKSHWEQKREDDIKAKEDAAKAAATKSATITAASVTVTATTAPAEKPK